MGKRSLSDQSEKHLGKEKLPGKAAPARRAPQAPAGASGVNNAENSPQRLALLEAAAHLFAERGYAGVTMDELAVRLQKKKATLYHYVATKEELILEIFIHGFRLMEQDIWPIVDSALRPDEKMRRVIHKYAELSCTNVFFRAVSLRGAVDMPEPHKTRVLRMFRNEERRFEAVIVDGQKAGLFREMPPRLMVLGFLGMCVWCGTWYSYAGFTPEEIASRFASLFERGWLSEADPSSRALPRPHSIKDAMSQVSSTVAVLKADVERLSGDLEQACLQLQDGLAPYAMTASRESSDARSRGEKITKENLIQELIRQCRTPKGG